MMTLTEPVAAPSAPARRNPWRLRVLALACSVLAAALLGEGAMRVRQWAKFGSSSPEVNAYVKDAASGLEIPVPGRDTGRIRIDSKGFRNPELAVPKPARRVRIAFLGASATFCAEASSNEATWPHLVCAKLREAFPGVEFDYVNAGISGYSTERSTRNLELRVRPLEPDVIVYYEAANDLSLDTRKLAIDAGLTDGESVDAPSALAKVSVLWNWIEKNVKVRMRMRAAAGGSNALRFDEATLAQGYRERLTTLLRSAKGAAPVVAVATFAWQVREGQPPERQLEACNTALFYMPWMNVEGLLRAMGAYNRAIREAAAASGAFLLDGEGEIPGDPAHFTDSVHLSDQGCRAQALRLAKRLAALPEIKALVDKKSAD
jgi:lysophospholipase L1-like esterase